MEKRDAFQMFPIFLGIIILCAVLRLYEYYFNFGIVIVEYIETFEILLSFIDIPNFLFILAFLAILIMILLEITTLNIFISKNLKINLLDKRLHLFLAFILLTIFISYFINSFYKKEYYYSDTDYRRKISEGILLGICYSTTILSIVRLFLLITSASFNFNRLMYNTIYFAISLYLLCMFDASNSSDDIIKKRKHFQFVSFEYKDQKIQTDSLNYYIGNTRNYLFMYNVKFKQTSIYPKCDISFLTYKKPDQLVKRNSQKRER
jgi:hypothetical protein